MTDPHDRAGGTGSPGGPGGPGGPAGPVGPRGGLGDDPRGHKQTIMRFKQEVFFKQNLDALEEFVHPDIIDHIARPDDPPGVEGVRKRFAEWVGAFKFVHHDKSMMIGEGDMLAYTWFNRGRHTGRFMGVEPTERDVDVEGIGIVRFRDGKIAEHWMVFDSFSIFPQIGVDLPMPVRADKAPEIKKDILGPGGGPSGTGGAPPGPARPR